MPWLAASASPPRIAALGPRAAAGDAALPEGGGTPSLAHAARAPEPGHPAGFAARLLGASGL